MTISTGTRKVKMDSWFIWLIVALIFFVLEMFAADFIVASVGIGCLRAGAVSLFGILPARAASWGRVHEGII